MAETEHEITPAGRTKVPSRCSCVERILSAWESLLNDVIKWNLETCAVSLPIDGSEDEKIHCFKADGPLSDGTEQVFTERAAAVFNALEEATCVNDNYPFELFCSGYGYRPHYNAENDHRKRSHSKTLSRVERFENDAF